MDDTEVLERLDEAAAQGDELQRAKSVIAELRDPEMPGTDLAADLEYLVDHSNEGWRQVGELRQELQRVVDLGQGAGLSGEGLSEGADGYLLHALARVAEARARVESLAKERDAWQAECATAQKVVEGMLETIAEWQRLLDEHGAPAVDEPGVLANPVQRLQEMTKQVAEERAHLGGLDLSRCETLRWNVYDALRDLCAYAGDTVWVGPGETLVDRLCAAADIEQNEQGEPVCLRPPRKAET